MPPLLEDGGSKGCEKPPGRRIFNPAPLFNATPTINNAASIQKPTVMYLGRRHEGADDVHVLRGRDQSLLDC